MSERKPPPRRRPWLDLIVFGFAFYGLGTLIVLVLAMCNTGCGGQAESAQGEQTAETPLHEDRWCCTRHFAYNGEPYLECGMPGDSIPEDAADCFCDAYLVDCAGE